MGLRADLHTILKAVLGSGHVYFQPPPTIKMNYPCIVYKRSSARTLFAGNRPYRYTKQYQITYIDKDPDSDIPDRIAKLERCTHDRFFTADGLNHDVFTLFF